MKRILIRLRNDISGSPKLRDEFLRDFSSLLGVPLNEMYGQNLRHGCTLFDAVLVKGAIERVVELYEKLKAGKTLVGPEAIAIRDFVQRWSVDGLTDDVWLRSVKPAARLSPITNVAIVFIHGLGGDGTSAFGELPLFLETSVGVPTLVYEYPSWKFTDSPSVVFVARNLDAWIRNRTDRCRIGIVAHSLGGLVARYLAVMQDERDCPLDIRQISLVASPTEGSAYATIATQFIQNTQIEELKSNSPFLVDLNARWMRWREIAVPGRCHLGTIFGVNDEVVDHASAIGLDPGAVPILGAGHLDIVKPVSINQEIVLTLSRFAREAGLASQAVVEH